MTIKPKTTRYLRASLVFTLLLLSNLRLLANSIPEIVAKAKPAVVEIVATDAKGTPQTLGTGFFISASILPVFPAGRDDSRTTSKLVSPSDISCQVTVPASQ
jgi:hypothetical protein